MEDLKIKVNSIEESKEAQELFFELGYKMGACSIGGYPAVIITTKEWSTGNYCSTRAIGLNNPSHKNHKEVTLQQLRDMVVLKRNELKPIEKEMKEYLEPLPNGNYVLVKSDKPFHSSWIEVPEGAEIAVYPHFSKGISFFKDGFRLCYVDSSGEWENTDYCPENLKHWESWRVAWQRETLNDKVASAEVARQKHNHYKKDVSHLKTIDVYRVIDLFGVESNAVGHAVKKLLCSGQRGAKDHKQDIQEAIDSLNRHLEMLAEDEAL